MRLGYWLAIAGAILLFLTIPGGLLSSIAPSGPSLAVYPANIQPDPCPAATPNCAQTIYHNIGGQTGASEVMLVIYLGSYSENLQTMTGGPPGYCNGSSCDTAVFSPLDYGTTPAPLTINWGDGTQTQIANYWNYPNNDYTMTAYSAPGDGLGEGWAYTNYEFFYHTYSQPGTYTVSAIPQANGPIASATYTVGNAVSNVTTTTTYQITTQTATTQGTTTTLVVPPTPPAKPTTSSVLPLFGGGLLVVGLLMVFIQERKK